MNRVICLLAAALLVSCAGTKTQSASERAWQKYDEKRAPSSEQASELLHTCVPAEGPNCRAKIMWHCPSGYVDGCNTANSTGKHICVEAPDRSKNCRQEIAVVCPEGFQDGCQTGRTESHRCVPVVSEAACGTPATVTCPQNFVDGCSESAMEPDDEGEDEL